MMEKNKVREYREIVENCIAGITNAIERSGVPHEKATDVSAYIGYLVFNDYYDKCIKEEEE